MLNSQKFDWKKCKTYYDINFSKILPRDKRNCLWGHFKKDFKKDETKAVIKKYSSKPLSQPTF